MSDLRKIYFLTPFYGFALSVTIRVDNGLIASELLELHGKENKSKNPIVGCKDREKTFKNEIRSFFLEKIKRLQRKSGLGGFAFLV